MRCDKEVKVQIQSALQRNSTLAKFVLGAHPIIDHFIDRLQIREILDEYLPCDNRMRIDDARTLALLIHNILTSQNALYEVEDWLRPLDAQKVGLTPQQARNVRDDKIGRALARFYRCNHKDVFFRLALRAIKVFRLDCSRIHHDTTSVTFAGNYGGWSVEELLTHGHNKDYRPDLKQLVLGLNVTADGAVPISHQVYNGNQSDDILHGANHRALQQLLSRTDFIYVADCKLATDDNLRKLSAWRGRFVSVMPRTWKEDGQFRQKVRHGEVKWKHLLSRRNNRKPDSRLDRYDVAVGDWQTSQGHRLHWIRSSQKAEADALARQRRIQRALRELDALSAKLNSYHLKTRAAIVQRIEGILKKEKCERLIPYELQATRVYSRRYQCQGRPTKDSPSALTWKETYSLSFQVDEAVAKAEEQVDGVFPLITNLNVEDHPAKKVLEIYKFQPFLEKRHSQLKTYQQIAPVHLKRDERVVAFLHVHVMALQVAALIERTLRQSMKRTRTPSLPIYPEGRACTSPTMFDIVRLFQQIERYEVRADNETLTFPAELSAAQKEVLKHLDVPVDSYV